MLFASSLSGASVISPKLNQSVIHWTQLSSRKGEISSPGVSSEQTASLILDVDKDGLNDFVIGMRQQGPSLVWYRRGPVGWTKYVIDSSFLPIEAGGATLDIDGDGDLDIIFGADLGDNKIWWWENPYPNYDANIPWTRREIKNSGESKHHDQLVGDFDGDGKPELVFWNQKARKLFVADIPEYPNEDTAVAN